jgi:hypothetical protein
MSVTPATVNSALESLVHEATSKGDIPEDIAHAAALAARRAFCHLQGRTLSAVERRRVSRYFDAVVRRRVIRGGAGRRVASRAVLRAVVEDLRSVGRDTPGIVEELERGWRGQVPDDVLEEATLGLAG